MSLTLSQISIPVFKRGLGRLSALLKQGVQFADEKQITHTELLNAQLIADMKDLIFQVQSATKTARDTCVRLGGERVESFEFENEEKTFEDLEKRIQRTLDFLDKVNPSAIDGREDTGLTLKFVQGDMNFTCLNYLILFAIPNFYFHVTTAYDIMRHKGVPVGKFDFLGPPPSL